jgi:hypothetical protein
MSGVVGEWRRRSGGAGGARWPKRARNCQQLDASKVRDETKTKSPLRFQKCQVARGTLTVTRGRKHRNQRKRTTLSSSPNSVRDDHRPRQGRRRSGPLLPARRRRVRHPEGVHHRPRPRQHRRRLHHARLHRVSEAGVLPAPPPPG